MEEFLCGCPYADMKFGTARTSLETNAEHATFVSYSDLHSIAASEWLCYALS